MKIVTHSGGLAETNTYLVADESTGHAVIIDAPVIRSSHSLSMLARTTGPSIISS